MDRGTACVTIAMFVRFRGAYCSDECVVGKRDLRKSAARNEKDGGNGVGQWSGERQERGQCHRQNRKVWRQALQAERAESESEWPEK